MRVGARLGRAAGAACRPRARAWASATLRVFGAHGLDIGALRLAREQRGDDADRAAGIGDVDRLARCRSCGWIFTAVCTRLVVAPPISSGMSKPSRSISAATWHHLVERRRDQAGQADDVDLLVARGLEDLLRRHHDAEVDDLVVVAGEHDADDVLADVVHVALDRRHQDLAGGGASRRRPVRSFSSSM